MNPKAKSLLFVLALVLLLSGILFVAYPRAIAILFSPLSSSKPEAKGIIIRNMTRQAISYDIKGAGSGDAARRIRLNPGAVDKLETRKNVLLTYARFGNEVRESLSPGRSYCFRYDEHGLPHLYLGSHMRKDVADLAPYLATPIEVARRMLEMAKVGSADVLYDLGCGDGRIVNLAAKEFGARGVGVDIDPAMIKRSGAEAKKEGVDDRVRFEAGDVMKTDISAATVVVIYLLPESNALLIPLFEKYLRPGARIVSHNYHIPGWEEKLADSVSMEDQAGTRHTIFMYVF